MKWFKHDADCDESEGLSYLISVEGFAGYGRWFRILEIVASKMDGSDRCHVEYPVQKWCSLLGLKQKKLISFLKLTENKLKTKVVYSNNVIRIEIPNLLNKRDEYSKKSRQNLDNVPHKNKEERNKIKDKEIKRGNPPADAPFILPSKEEMQEASEPMILSQIEQICGKLYTEKIFPEVNAFKNTMLKQKKNPRSILHTLCRAYIKKEFSEGPWAYCHKTILNESQNYNARDYAKTT